jgi:hypothetical protein
MKKQLLLAALLLCFQISFGQCPTTDIILTTQADIDNFAANYPNCSILSHELRVDGANNPITNLNGLTSIIEAEDIFILSTQLTNLFGLDNLESVSHLALWGNQGLVDMSGLSALQSVGDLEVWVNPGIVSMDGMDNLQSLDGLNLFANNSLADISQFSFVQELHALTIGGNALTSLNGLENLQTVLEDVTISNEAIDDFNELSNLHSIGGSLLLSNNPAQDVSAFSNITNLVDLYVVECPNLMDLSGLQNVQTLSGRLRIGFNPGLTNLLEFINITSVGNLDIYENENLISLRGLENLEVVSERLLIMDNPVLHGIESIENVSTTDILELVILNNASLSLCANDFVCGALENPAVTKTIFNNNTGCNSIAEVEAECLLLGVSDIDLTSAINVYPNPVNELLSIHVSDGIVFEKATVYSVLGQRLITSIEKEINMASLSQGVYFVNINTDRGTITFKLVKE